ncbi:MAG: FadR family transcriptional regulator [Deltaproteobacteria bacterium]|nr:FadR family transcriptional regulator [Deltaproteobacteria bacterium]
MFQAASKYHKISDQIIDQFRDAILSGQLKPGERVASEKELILQFGVSKATLREALRVLEAMGLIEIRKGTAGGAFVAEADMRATLNSLVNFLRFEKISVREITMFRYLIEPTVAGMAATQITEKDIFNLRKIIGRTVRSGKNEVSKEIGFHRYLARLVDNTLLNLIIDFVDNILRTLKTELQLGEDFYRNVRRSHRFILECLIQKDPIASAVAMSNDLVEVGDYLARVTKTPPFDPRELPQLWASDHWHLLLNPGARIVAEGDPLAKKEGVFLKRVGTSPLYLASQPPTGITKRSSK